MYLFFDTETAGLPRSWRAPVTALNNWPRMVQIAWILCDAMGQRLDAHDYIIRPENFKIPGAAAKVHGISTERARREGYPLATVLGKFNEALELTDFVVAHNIRFDEKIIGAELLRKKIPSALGQKRKLCTMQAATEFCRLPGPYGYKWPRLSELHIKLFGVNFEEAHDASADINATEKCFWAMRKLGLI